MSIAIVSGYFDPLHKGHLDLIRKAKKYGDVFIIVNNNHQTIMKKGKPFMDDLERLKIVSSLKDVSRTFCSIDEDKSVCKTIEYIKFISPEWENIFFINGDEYTKKNCAEHKTCKELGIKPIYGEGKKIQSSSWLTK